MPVASKRKTSLIKLVFAIPKTFRKMVFWCMDLSLAVLNLLAAVIGYVPVALENFAENIEAYARKNKLTKNKNF
jgi:putative Ca2+/H+ antiporter (TMEM165/GDT1 family)